MRGWGPGFLILLHEVAADSSLTKNLESIQAMGLIAEIELQVFRGLVRDPDTIQ